MARIGVALSGGGHRATVWGLGALMAVVDAAVNDSVVSVSSVSGGSIANGIVVQQVDFTQTTREEFEEKIRPALRNIASEGLFFFGRETNSYIIGFFVAASFALGTLVGLLVATTIIGRHQPEPARWLLIGPGLARSAVDCRYRRPLAPHGPFSRRSRTHTLATAPLLTSTASFRRLADASSEVCGGSRRCDL